MSALPAARRTLLGCQSTDSTVDRMGFFNSLDTHQLFSGSNEQIAIALDRTCLRWTLITIEIANPPCTAGHSKFVFLRAPFDIRRCSVDPQQHQRGLPNNLPSFWIRLLLPHISVSVLRTGNNTVGIGCPINRGDQFVVLNVKLISDPNLNSGQVAHFGQGHSGYPLCALASEYLCIIAVQAGGQF